MTDPTEPPEFEPTLASQGPAKPDANPWAEHSACEQRITDDGQRIAELEADLARIRSILLDAGLHPSIENRTRATWHLAEEAAALWKEYPEVTSANAEALYEIERLRGALEAVAAKAHKSVAWSSYTRGQVMETIAAALEGEPHG